MDGWILSSIKRKHFFFIMRVNSSSGASNASGTRRAARFAPRHKLNAAVDSPTDTSDCWCDVATVAWRCLTLENNGMRSWPRSRVWRVHRTRVRVSNVAPLYECDVTLTWVGSQEVCCSLHSPFKPLWDHDLSVQLVTE